MTVTARRSSGTNDAFELLRRQASSRVVEQMRSYSQKRQFLNVPRSRSPGIGRKTPPRMPSAAAAPPRPGGHRLGRPRRSGGARTCPCSTRSDTRRGLIQRRSSGKSTRAARARTARAARGGRPARDPRPGRRSPRRRRVL